MAEAYLIGMRHGQTTWNVLKLMSGQSEVPLTYIGESQSRAAGPLIRDIRIDAAYCSFLSRTFNTTVLTLASAGTQDHLFDRETRTWRIERREELNDFNTGSFTGLNHKTDPQVVELDEVRGYDTRLPEGESERDVVERVKRRFDSEIIPRLQKGENILIVAHSDILNVFDIVLGLEKAPTAGGNMPTTNHIPNATPIFYKYKDGVITKEAAIVNPKEMEASGRKVLMPALRT